MAAMRALVFANGEPPSAALAAEFVAGADLVVAADGGAQAALALRIRPTAVVGDLDSLTEASRAALPGAVFVRDDHPDFTDLQKAIEHCIAAGATEIDILGAAGGRSDHALANLSVLVLYRDRARVRIVDELFVIEAVARSATIDAPAGTIISLVAVGPCEGVTTTGMRWNLTDHRLTFGPRGVHNEVAVPPATVSIRTGDLLLFRGRRIEKHT
jgi:thiamine pyrophosphokinase